MALLPHCMGVASVTECARMTLQLLISNPKEYRKRVRRIAQKSVEG